MCVHLKFESMENCTIKETVRTRWRVKYKQRDSGSNSTTEKIIQTNEKTCNKISLNLPKFMSSLEFNFLAREQQMNSLFYVARANKHHYADIRIWCICSQRTSNLAHDIQKKKNKNRIQQSTQWIEHFSWNDQFTVCGKKKLCNIGIKRDNNMIFHFPIIFIG